MAKMEYIERRKLWDEVVKSKTNNSHLNEIQRQTHIHEHRAFQRMIIEQPTADVVEVVRCKDCIYSKEYNYLESIGKCMCERKYVHNGIYKKPALLEVSKDDFCSYGERKPLERGSD